MKRILALFLTVLMLLGTVSCSSEKSVRLEAGFGRVSVTPAYDDSDGQNLLLEPINTNSKTIATSVYNEIYASAIAITDGETQILLISADLRDMSVELCSRIAERIEAETGVPKNNVMIAATHNHSAPSLTLYENDQLILYKDYLVETIPQAAVLAMEDLAPATMSVGRAQTPGMNFVRRYIMSDGSLVSIVNTNPDLTYVSHESEPDTEFQTLRLAREDKKDIILSNWQCHPAAMYPENTINSDWVHYMREGVEKKHDAFFAFFNGGLGNINHVSRIPGEMVFGKNAADKSTVENLGYGLVSIVNLTLREMQPIEAGRINVKRTYPKDTGGTVPLFVATIGDFAIAGNPFEMFHQHGEYVKENSPYKMTFFVSLANGAEGYMPTKEAYARGGYEKDACRYAPFVGDATTKTLLDTLKEFKKSDAQQAAE